MSPADTHAKLVYVLGYTLPRLHEGKKWYVDFYALDPSDGQPRRKKYYIPEAGRKRDRRQNAAAIIEKITAKLRSGWLPWETSKQFACTLEIERSFEIYLEYIGRSHRKTSIHSYTSRVNVLKEYISTLTQSVKYLWQLDGSFVTGFLDWLLTVRNVSSRTYNNYRGWAGSFFDFFISRKDLDTNPVNGIKKLMESKKQRQQLSASMLHDLFRHLTDTDKPFLLACMMEYYTFIRPAELRHVRLSDISIKDQKIYIGAEHSKNKRSGNVSLNESIITLMLDLGVFNNPCDYYLFGRGFLPSAGKCPADAFNKRWAQVRKHLKWDSTIKFYSLKDSGIRDLSNSAGVVIARDQARHTDISTTNRYLQGRDSQSPEAAKHFKGNLN